MVAISVIFSWMRSSLKGYLVATEIPLDPTVSSLTRPKVPFPSSFARVRLLMFAVDKSFRVFVGADTGKAASTIPVIVGPVFGSTRIGSSSSTGLAAAEDELLARTGAFDFDFDFDLDLDPDPDLDRDFRVDAILYSTFRYFRAAFVAAKRTPPQTVSAIAIFRSYFFKIE